jgi:uncharacterized membrane protein
MNMRNALAGCLLAALVAAPAAAQQEAPGDASMLHSAAKATTFKAGTVAVNLAVFSAATGGIFGGAVLTAFNLGKSWMIYAANDYLWDSYSPDASNRDGGQAFDSGASLWRTTEKFLTYKPVGTAVKFLSLYVYTGSAAIALSYGTASAVANTAVFYVNDYAWDLYEWAQSAPRPDLPQPRVLAMIPTAPAVVSVLPGSPAPSR